MDSITRPWAEQRVGPMAALPAILRERGIDPAPIAAAGPISVDDLADPTARVSFYDCARVIKAAAAATGCPHLGLLIGQRCDFSGLGLPGQLALAAPDVETGLRVLTRLQHMNSRGGLIYISNRGGEAALHYAHYAHGVDAADHIIALCIAIAFNGLSQLCGPEWRPTAVELTFRPPADPRPYLEFFRAPVRFNAPQSRVSFPASWLSRSLPSADPELFARLQGQAARTHRIDTAAQLRRILRQMVEEGAATAQQAARALGLHPRTLDRRLSELGTSYRAILDEVRSEVACHLLRDSDLGIVEIGSLLGYANPSALTRAFRRWSGYAPAQWRDMVRSGRGTSGTSGEAR
ncbi:MAG: AraC family transcriptional regulator [Dongiaceae bacterium]